MESLKHLKPSDTGLPPRRRLKGTKGKHCSKCSTRKPLTEFYKSPDSSDGYQAYCRTCKNGLHKKRRQKNISFRLKHHFATRITKQLGAAAPIGISKNLEMLLGYNMRELKKSLDKEIQEREGISLREGINNGYHVDHIKPLSTFDVISPDGTVDWGTFRECWRVSNLKLISAEANLQKGAKYYDS